MSYDMIDRFLRNNLDDDNYAQYSAALDELCTPPAQRTWVGLTDGDIYKMTILMGFNPEWKPEVEMVYSIVRNLEVKLKEKNT